MTSSTTICPKKYKLQWTRPICTTGTFSVVSQNFSDISLLVKNGKAEKNT